MKNRTGVISIVCSLLSLTGCQMLTATSGSDYPAASLDLTRKIDVIEAVVENPWPDCVDSSAVIRIANLSQPRQARTYLEQETLCQRSE